MAKTYQLTFVVWCCSGTDDKRSIAAAVVVEEGVVRYCRGFCS